MITAADTNGAADSVPSVADAMLSIVCHSATTRTLAPLRS